MDTYHIITFEGILYAYNKWYSEFQPGWAHPKRYEGILDFNQVEHTLTTIPYQMISYYHHLHDMI